MDTHINDDILISSERILSRLLEQVWVLLLIFLNLAALGALARAVASGWLPMHSLPLTLALFFSGCHLLRRHLSFDVRIGIVMIMFYVAGIAALYVFNIVAAGAWWLILCALLGILFYPRAIGVTHAVACLLLICGAAWGFIAGHLSLPFDAAVYIRNPVTWAGLIIGCVLLSLFIFAAIATYQRAVLGLLREVSESRLELEQCRQQLQTLRQQGPVCSRCRKPLP